MASGHRQGSLPPAPAPGLAANAAFAPGGKHLVVFNRREAQVWGTATGELRVSLRSPTSLFPTTLYDGGQDPRHILAPRIAFSADGKRLATVQHFVSGWRESDTVPLEDQGGEVKVWEPRRQPETAAGVARPHRHGRPGHLQSRRQTGGHGQRR